MRTFSENKSVNETSYACALPKQYSFFGNECFLKYFFTQSRSSGSETLKNGSGTLNTPQPYDGRGSTPPPPPILYSPGGHRPLPADDQHLRRDHPHRRPRRHRHLHLPADHPGEGPVQDPLGPVAPEPTAMAWHPHVPASCLFVQTLSQKSHPPPG